MNTKRIVFWLCFIVVIGLIIWGMIAAMDKKAVGPSVGAPAPVTATDHVKGSTDAPVTIIEYSDFQCPACEAYYPVVERIMAEMGTSTMIVYRHFPLSQHANAMISAQASEAASLQGKFWEMYSELFVNHTDWTEVADPRSIFEGYAKKIGLDVVRFKADLDSDAVKQAVVKQQDEGTSIGISYTPSFFVNGKLIDNPQSYEAFKTVIQAAAQGSTK